MSEPKRGSWLARLFGRQPTAPAPARKIEIPPQFRYLGDPRRAEGAESSGAPPAGDPIDTPFLRQQLLNFLTPLELVALGERVGVDVVELPGGKGRKAMALLQALERREALPALLEACRALKPEVAWQPDR